MHYYFYHDTNNHNTYKIHIEVCISLLTDCFLLIDIKTNYLSLLLFLLKKVGSARLRESDIHPISPKTLARQYQPINRKKRKGKIVED